MISVFPYIMNYYRIENESIPHKKDCQNNDSPNFVTENINCLKSQV